MAAVCGIGNLYADVISADVFAGSVSYNGVVIILPDVRVMPDSWVVNKMLRLDNYGTLATDMYVADNASVMIKNNGVVNSDFYLGNNAKVVQVVNSADDMNTIDFGVSYDVLVDGADDLDLGVLVGFADMAETLVLRNSELRISDGFSDKVGRAVEIDGQVRLFIDTPSDWYGKAILGNVSGDGEIVVRSNNANPMYVDWARVENGQLILGRRRETQYVKVLGDKVGAFLDSVRTDNPNYPMFDVLDGASDMDGLRDVMGRSVRLNPSALARVGRIINRINSVGVTDDAIGLRMDAAFSDELNVYGVTGAIGYSGAKWDVGLRLQAGVGEYANSIDEFNLQYYNVGINIKRNFDDAWFVRSGVSFGTIKTDVGDVMYSDNVIHNPSMQSGFVVIDNGVNLYRGDSFVVRPFAGVVSEITKVDDTDLDMDFDVRVGCDFDFVADMMGIEYKYGARISANTNGDVILNGRVGFWSLFDNAGGDINLGVMRTFDTVVYQVGIGAKIWF